MSHGDPSYPGNAITKDEWDILNRKPSTSTAINIAKNINVQNGFSVGETLICINKHTQKPYTTNDGVTPQKYMVIHKDDCGMIYCKRITSGRLGKGIEIIATWRFNDAMFVQDPDVIEHVLLGNEADYDPFRKSRLLANLRQRITKHNNEFSLRFDDGTSAQQWIDTVPVGFTFWKGNESEAVEFKVTGRIQPARQSWQSQNTKMDNQLQVRGSDGQNHMMSAYEFTTRYSKFYKEKPRVFKDEADGVEFLKQRKPRKKKSAVAPTP
jgi:hypothetical protein